MSTTTMPRPRTNASGRRRSKWTLGPREARRLIQLGICLAVFLAVFIGKGVFPDRIEAIRGEVLEVLGKSTDFQSAFSSLGEAIAGGESVSQALNGLWVEVFGPSQHSGLSKYQPVTGTRQAYLAEQTAMLSGPTVESVLSRLGSVPQAEPVPEAPSTADEPVPTPEPVPSFEPTPEPYTGPELPEHTSMSKVDLGLSDTVAPVMGTITSQFGYRDHPIDGEYKFHYGTDIGVSSGTAIGAFADGVVDFIGESPAYGLYIQVRHDGGVTSFYAHCSKLCAEEGDTVVKGQKIAEAGQTGNATGPHLHLELKQDGVYYNPAYYIETQ